MDSYSVADAKARFSEVVERAEAGEIVDITKRGKLVARVVPVLKPIDVDRLDRLAAQLPVQKEDAGTFIRRMRDEARY